MARSLLGVDKSDLNAYLNHMQKAVVYTTSQTTGTVMRTSKNGKARSHLWANVFDPLNDELLRLVDEHLPESPRWQGFRVLAADASKVRLTLLDGEGC